MQFNLQLQRVFEAFVFALIRFRSFQAANANFVEHRREQCNGKGHAIAQGGGEQMLFD